MNPLVDMLVLTGFLSAVFCVLGIIAGFYEWVEQQYRLTIVPLWLKPLPTRVKKPPVKKAGKRKTVKTSGKARQREIVVRVSPSFGVHRKAA